jgi:predicted nucleotidyltransferase
MRRGMSDVLRTTKNLDRRQALERVCESFGLLAVYLFGSRADDGLRLLEGKQIAPEGSDLDVGVVLRGQAAGFRSLSQLQVDLEEVFAPLCVDLVPLQRVDALFQFSAIDGHRVAVTDSHEADEYELVVMNRAAELLPIQRQIEIDRFGVSTS